MSKGSGIRPAHVTREQWGRFWDDIFTGISNTMPPEAPPEVEEKPHTVALRPPTFGEEEEEE